MTSGNISEEPILYRDSDMHRLDLLADAYLTHDRPIHIRADDSVMRFMNARATVIRRSRGYAPEPIDLPKEQPATLACGALLKNSITFTTRDRAFISQFIGDLENMETYKAFEQTIEHFRNLFKVTPEAIACDSHPDFISSDYAARLAANMDKPLYRIQHHHAHLAACLGENKWDGKAAIGLCYDGTGYGEDGAIWGGEVLLGNYVESQRRYHLEYMPLPGGDSSIRKPYRMALAYLAHAGIEWSSVLPPVPYCRKPERDLLTAQLAKGINTIPTSSLGRLFDVVASLVGIGQHASYEGQLAIELENAIDPLETGQYSFDFEDDIILVNPLLRQVVNDYINQVPASAIAAKFHNGLAQLNLNICEKIRAEHGLDSVALSGGVWQNKTLFESTINLLTRHGFHVLTHQQLPANDGCISYGQAIIAGHLLLERKS